MWGLHAPLPATHDQYGVVLVLAFFLWPELDGLYALLVDDEGRLHTSNVDRLGVEWRFNWNTHKWEDQDTGDLYDEAGDGSEEISGDIPDVDRADRSDSGDQGHGEIGDLVPE